MLSEWRVVQNTNPRLPSFAVRAKPVGRMTVSEDALVLWEGTASSRQSAWDEAVKKHAWLANIPFPSTYQSTDVFAKVRPRRNEGPKSGKSEGDLRGRKTMGPVRDGILAIALRNGEAGVTAEELKTELPGIRPGSIDGEFAYLKQFRWMVRHPTDLSRVSKKGKPLDAFILDPGAVPKDELERISKIAIEDIQAAIAKVIRRTGNRPVNPQFNGHTKRIRSAILAVAREAGDNGVTLSEVREYVETNVPGANRGSIQSRHAELAEIGLLILHPAGLKRSSVDPPARGRLQRVHVFSPLPVLIAWADYFHGLASQPRFKRVLDAINDLRTGPSGGP